MTGRAGVAGFARIPGHDIAMNQSSVVMVLVTIMVVVPAAPCVFGGGGCQGTGQAFSGKAGRIAGFIGQEDVDSLGCEDLHGPLADR